MLEPVVRMQETAYIHDAARLLASDIASNDLLAEIHYPDTQRITIGSITKPQPVQLDYNRQGEVVAMRDPNTTLHEYSRDLLGRMTLDGALHSFLRHPSGTRGHNARRHEEAATQDALPSPVHGTCRAVPGTDRHVHGTVPYGR